MSEILKSQPADDLSGANPKNNDVSPGLDLLAEFEKNERAGWKCLYTGKTDQAGETFPVVSRHFGSVFAGGVPGPDILAYNRVLGIGLEEPVSGELLQQIRSFYQENGIRRVFMPVYPFISDPGIKDLLSTHGFILYNHWSKLWRSLDDFQYTASTGVEVVRTGPESASLFGSILSGAFGFSTKVGNIFSATFSDEGYRHYLVMKNGTPIAAGALYIRGIYASMAIAGTLPDYRGLGAQTALLNTRMRDAAEAGCRFAITETGMDTPEKPVPSFRNMIRSGYTLAYLRPNYIMYTNA